MQRNPKSKLSAILTAPDKQAGRTFGTKGILANFFRNMLRTLNIGPTQFGSLLQDYITDIRHHIPDNRADKTSARGNLTKEFSNEQMSWSVFCKALRFLQIVRFELIINAHHANGKVSLHSEVVNLGSRKEIKQFMDDLEKKTGDAVTYVQCLESPEENELNQVPSNQSKE